MINFKDTDTQYDWQNKSTYMCDVIIAVVGHSLYVESSTYYQFIYVCGHSVTILVRTVIR